MNKLELIEILGYIGFVIIGYLIKTLEIWFVNMFGSLKKDEGVINEVIK